MHIHFYSMGAYWSKQSGALEAEEQKGDRKDSTKEGTLTPVRDNIKLVDTPSELSQLSVQEYAQKSAKMYLQELNKVTKQELDLVRKNLQHDFDGNQMPDTPSKATPPESPVRKMDVLYGSPSQRPRGKFAQGLGDSANKIRSASSVRREIEGYAEKPDYTRVPRSDEIYFEYGKLITDPGRVIEKIEAWIKEQQYQKIDKKIIQYTQQFKEAVENEFEKKLKKEPDALYEIINNICTIQLRL